MAAPGSAILTVLLSALVVVYTVKDGTQVSQCDYPGVVALVSSTNNVIICGGIRVGGVLYLAQICGAALEEALPKETVYLFYGDGEKNVTIPAGPSGTVDDGVYKLDITETMTSDCNNEAVLYDKSMDISTSSCEIAGYGGGELSAKIYDGVLNSATLTKSTSYPCCKTIYESLSQSQRDGVVDSDVPLNCGASSGSACGTGDLGSPVYCNITNGARVVVGLVASSPCENGETFLIHDLTGNDKFKFGITP